MKKLAMLIALALATAACKKHQSIPIPPTAAPQPAARKRPQPAPTPARGSTHTPAPASTRVTPAAEAPRLGQMLSPVEERHYNSLIDQSLGQAKGNLDSLANRILTADQQTDAREIRELIRQANEARKTDLVSAKGLADKAQVLARDLVNNVK